MGRMMAEKAATVTEAQVAATAAVMSGHKDHVVAGKALKVRPIGDGFHVASPAAKGHRHHAAHHHMSHGTANGL
jgi:hypothetical protein